MTLPPDVPTKPAPLQTEQIKLAATYFNGLAIAVGAIGVLQPLIGSAPLSLAVTLRVLICVLISLLLHLLGQAILTGIKP